MAGENVILQLVSYGSLGLAVISLLYDPTNSYENLDKKIPASHDGKDN